MQRAAAAISETRSKANPYAASSEYRVKSSEQRIIRKKKAASSKLPDRRTGQQAVSRAKQEPSIEKRYEGGIQPTSLRELRALRKKA